MVFGYVFCLGSGLLTLQGCNMKRYRWECIACGEKNIVGECFCSKCFHVYEQTCKMFVDQGPLTKEDVIEAVKGVRSRGYF